MTMLILGILIGVVFTVLAYQPRGIKLAWFDWVLLALAGVLFVLAITNYQDSLKELEPTAAWFLLFSFGIPGVIFAAIVGVRAWRNSQASAPTLTDATTS